MLIVTVHCKLGLATCVFPLCRKVPEACSSSTATQKKADGRHGKQSLPTHLTS